MRVAALYDIHGNLPALEAVLSVVAREGADLIVVGGDVLPGPMPSECLSRLLGLPTPVRFLRGNGENDVLRILAGETPKRVPEPFRETMSWVAEQLPPELVAEIESWPTTVRVQVSGVGDVLFCHATPRNDNELFTRITPERRLRPVMEDANARMIVCGHTHMQFDRMIGEVQVINAGSVGMPFGEPGAYWLLLDATPELRCTPYDFRAAEGEVRETAYPMASAFELVRPPSEEGMLDAFETATLK